LRTRDTEFDAAFERIATLTRQFVDAIDGTGARVLDTRKTVRDYER